MLVYYRTKTPERILREGFRDAQGTYLTGEVWSGVWLIDRPLPVNAAEGETLLRVDIEEEILANHEWVEEGKPYREFLVPADVVNEHGTKPIIAPP